MKLYIVNNVNCTGFNSLFVYIPLSMEVLEMSTLKKRKSKNLPETQRTRAVSKMSTLKHFSG